MQSTSYYKDIDGDLENKPEGRVHKIPSTLPDKYTVDELDAYLAQVDPSSSEEKIGALRVLHASLTDERLQVPNDGSSVPSLCGRIASFLKPAPHLFVEGHPEYTEDEGPKSQWRDGALLALRSLSLLLDRVTHDSRLKSSILLSLIAFGSPADAWSSEEASDIASKVLRDHGPRAWSTKFIIEDVLQDYIRPLFMKSRPDTVTAQGRKATVERIPHERYSASHLYDPVKKPWKFRDVASITIFRWAIAKSDKELMAANWHLFIPPVLTLLDDPNTPIRLSGMAALRELLDKVPSRMLEQTGLGDVMEQAMIPTLSFLPTLTPADESLLLLSAAYDTLLKLTDVRFDDKKLGQKKQKTLDKLVREGVLHGMDHCQQNGQIMRQLLVVMAELVNRAKIQSIKHLKDITPILYTLLMDPFAPTNSDNLIQAIRALHAVILNCWPILFEDRHRIELLKALSVCWIHITDELEDTDLKTQSELENAREQLCVAAAILSRAMPDDHSLAADIEQLVRVEPRIASLFRQNKHD